MTGFNVGRAVAYATLPGILPRVRSLFLSGFGNLSQLLALVFAMVRLLPEDHPLLDPRNSGKYGIRHVTAAALNNLEFRWKNIDQIIVFFAILAGCVALLMYVVGLVAFLLVSPVMAQTWFATLWPEQDIAFLMLDQVFGVPGIFNSDVTTNVGQYGPFPNSFQVGLQSLFQFYSMGLFLLSVFVFLYYIITIVAETSITGTPFGSRFNNVWVPVRIVAALGLLMPWSADGLNSAQYIVLYTAKYGSGMATNTWITYNDVSTGNPLGLTNIELISKPATPDYTQLIKSLLLIRGCITMYDAQMLDLDGTEYSRFGVAEFMIRGNTAQTLLPADPADLPNVKSRFTGNAVAYGGYNGTFLPALDFSNGSDIRLVFGEYGETYTDYPGNIFPACGEVIIPISGMTPEALYTAEAYMAAVVRTIYGMPRVAGTLDGNEDALYIAVGRNYFQESASFRQIMRQWAYAAPSGALPNPECFWDGSNDGNDQYLWDDPTELTQLGQCEGPVLESYWRAIVMRLQQAFANAPLTGWDYLTGGVTAEDPVFSPGDVYFQTLGDPNPLAMDMGILIHGWGGAGLWYNRIAEKNGSLMAAVGSVPFVKRQPYVMEQIKEQRLKSDAKVEETGCEVYNPNKSGETSIADPDVRHQFPAELATALYSLCSQLNENEMIQQANGRGTKYTNPILNMINALFGADTLFNVVDNRQTHPMAMLVTLGRTLIDKAIFNFAAAAGTSIAGGINQITLGKGSVGFSFITMAASNLSKMFVSFGLIAIVSGVMLYYVLPFMPFMYFFFAVGRWVKTIFEAMVGVPLWALAHLSLKGPGLPGTAASTGYFLILEIFIRPVLTVLSLVAAFATFAAMVYGLNAVFALLTANIFGANSLSITQIPPPADVRMMRNLVDQLFLTIIYVIIVYIIGTTCFKLIDLIPDNILRWSGAGARSWGGSDNADELVDQAGRMIALPTYFYAKDIGRAITSLGDAAAAEAAGEIKSLRAEAAQKAKENKGGGAASGKDTDGDGVPDRPPVQPNYPDPGADMLEQQQMARAAQAQQKAPTAADAYKQQELARQQRAAVEQARQNPQSSQTPQQQKPATPGQSQPTTTPPGQGKPPPGTPPKKGGSGP